MHESKADTSLESNVQRPRVETLDTPSELELALGSGTYDWTLDLGRWTSDFISPSFPCGANGY